MSRRYASNPKGKRCDCGNPADKFTSSGWSCLRCIKLNKDANEMVERAIRITRLTDKYDYNRAEMMWDNR